MKRKGFRRGRPKNPKKVWQIFLNQLNVHVNFRIQRLFLMQYQQKDRETLDEFVTRACTQALFVITGTIMEIFCQELRKGDSRTGKPESPSKRPFLLDTPRKKPCRNFGTIYKYRECLCAKWKTSGNNRSKPSQPNKHIKHAKGKHLPKRNKAVHTVKQTSLEESEYDSEGEGDKDVKYAKGFYTITLSDTSLDSVCMNKMFTNIDVHKLEWSTSPRYPHLFGYSFMANTNGR